MDIDDFELHTWFERDRKHVRLDHNETGHTLIELWDEAVDREIEDGFLDPSDYKGSLYEMALLRGLEL